MAIRYQPISCRPLTCIILGGAFFIATTGWSQHPFRELKHDMAVTTMSLSTDEAVLAIGYGQAGRKGEIILWDSKTGKKIANWTATVLSFLAWGLLGRTNSWSPSASTTLCAVWNVATKQMVANLEDLDGVTGFRIVGDANQAVTFEDKTLCLWNLNDPLQPKRTKEGFRFGKCSHFAFSTDGKLLAKITNEGLTELPPKKTAEIEIWDVVRGKLSTFYGQDSNNATCLRLSADGRFLAVGYFFGDENVEVHDVKTGKLVFEGKGHQNPPHCFAFSPDSKTLISGDYLGRIIVWDIENKTVKANVPATTRPP